MPHTTASVEDLVARMQAEGLRATTARRAVLSEIVAADSVHLTADELARRIQAEHPAIHLSTVYRTLESLTTAGLLSIARFRDEPVTYHLSDDVHHHAVCTECGTTLDLPADVLDPLRRGLEREHGFVADPHHLTIPGRCARCVGRG